jgi:hypothetical protein
MDNLEKAVIKQLGYRTPNRECKETLANVSRYGADQGVNGFTYYRDTVSFFNKNRALIIEVIKSLADDLGEEPLAMVAGFNCLKGHDITVDEVARCFYGRPLKNDQSQELIKNACAWFALEEVARRYDA